VGRKAKPDPKVRKGRPVIPVVRRGRKVQRVRKEISPALAHAIDNRTSQAAWSQI
jgi:hypothetical protein